MRWIKEFQWSVYITSGVMMPKILRSVFAMFTVFFFALNVALAQNINLLPKYGPNPKNEAQQTADAKFIATVDEYYKGDREKGAEEMAAKGWEALRQKDINNAMRRFNQSWLINNSNGTAIWGMAVIQAVTGHPAEAMKLFTEAERTIGKNIDFATDYAKAIGVAGVSTKDTALIHDAFKRFAQVYEKTPEHVANLQNWAITLFLVGNYPEAWKKIQLAEVAPRGSELDQKFIAALKSKLFPP
jgi:tetratricopeptide (TPR) repeat protein